ncbi:MAG: DUF2029 domain-containing protein [Deltaproteobacteria bacterium]|nr:DUF2029 domain-containing protein [Deltaproteobacteria bacterium]
MIPALSERTRRWLVGLLAVLAIVWAGSAIWSLWAEISWQKAHNLDFLPLWLGGRALLHRMDPTDPEVLARLFSVSDVRMRCIGFHTYYPQSAALVFLPLGAVPFWALDGWLQAAFGLALVAGMALPAGSTSRGARAMASMALATGIVASLRMTPLVVGMGQSNAILVLLAGLGVWALARDRTAWGGAAIGLGIAIKLFPLVLLVPAMLGRRWRLVGIAVAVPLLALGISLGFYAGPWAGSPLGAGAAAFVGEAMHPAWAEQERSFVLALWSTRLWLPGLLAVGLTAWAARRPDPAVIPALAALWIAWVGTAMAGTSMPHQAILILPAVGWLLAWPTPGRRIWPALAAGVLVAAVANWRHVLTEHWPRTLQWLPVCWAVVLGCSVRVVDLLLPPGWAAGRAAAGSDPSATTPRPRPG